MSLSCEASFQRTKKTILNRIHNSETRVTYPLMHRGHEDFVRTFL
jgi:hypothetical protein